MNHGNRTGENEILKFDAIIIGSGQAGNPLAHNLADRGWSVALLERDQLGGSCVNYGCTPTKRMVASAQMAHYARRAPEFGVNTGKVIVDLPKIVQLKKDIVNQWRDGQEQQANKRPSITVFRGEGSFTGPKTISVNSEQLTSDKIFINTGTSPRVLPIEGIHNVPYLTNRNIMDVQELPDHLMVIGGSYIGLEFGQMFRRFGSRVTIVEYSDRIIPREDGEVSETLQQELAKEQIRFITSAVAKSITKDSAGQLQLSVESVGGQESEIITGSHLLLAAGRKPNTDSLNLADAGIETDRGFVKVNDYLETNVPGVYALGDVKGGPAFTHISYNDFQVAYHNLFHADKKSIKDRLVAYSLFTDPELGRVGLTETQAREAGMNLIVGSIPMSRVARAIERDETAGLMKVVINADTDRILGASILGSNGGELVQTLMTMMLADAPWTLLKGAVYIHPTLTEGFFALMESVKQTPQLRDRESFQSIQPGLPE